MTNHDPTIRRQTPTRRDAITYGGAVVCGGLLAGCTNDSTRDGVDDSGDGSYSVTMAPAGTVQFDEPPETVFTRLTHHAGMAFALGRGDGVNAMHAPDYSTRRISAIRVLLS